MDDRVAMIEAASVSPSRYRASCISVEIRNANTLTQTLALTLTLSLRPCVCVIAMALALALAMAMARDLHLVEPEGLRIERAIGEREHKRVREGFRKEEGGVRADLLGEGRDGEGETILRAHAGGEGGGLTRRLTAGEEQEREGRHGHVVSRIFYFWKVGPTSSSKKELLTK